MAYMPEIDDEMRGLMAETREMLERGELEPAPMDMWWEGRRENEQTPDYLGRVLDEAGLVELASNARMAHYDDFHAPAGHADGCELIRLVRDLRRAVREAAPRHEDPAGFRERVAVIENAARRGEFDATRAESDRWAVSKDGQETFGELVAGARRSKVGRNDPCTCGSGKKWKRCHGA